MRVFHGTTKAGLEAIINNTGEIPSLWSCSDRDNRFYVWPFDKIALDYDYDFVDDIDSIHERGICQAFESAQVQALASDHDKIYCIEFEIDNDLLQDDDSCENMGNASCFDSELLPSVKIVAVYENDFNVYHKPFILCRLLGNIYLNYYDLDKNLVTIAETLKDSGIYLDELYEFNYKSLPLSELGL